MAGKAALAALIRLLACIGVAIALSACAQRVQTNITEFHKFQGPPRGKTFAMVPYDAQQGSLEWKTYADLVAAQLVKNGLVQVDSAANADFGVFIVYAIDSGRTSVTSVPIYGQTGGGTTSTTTGFVGTRPVSATTYTPPTYGVTGYAPVESTVYGRGLKITMLDVRQTVAEKRAVTVYEATAVSAGSSANLNVVMGPMIRGVFTDWPGASGGTRRETVGLKE